MLIAQQETEKTTNEEKHRENLQALKDAKSRGKEALAAEEACIAAEKAASEEAKKVEKLRAAAEKKANKAREAEAKRVSSVCLSLTMYSSMQSKTQSRKATKGRADVDT